MKTTKQKLPICYILFSGGLDSRLALKLMQDQSPGKFKMIALTFKFPFGSGCCQPDCSFKFTQIQGVEHKIIDCTQGKLFTEYLSIVKQPKFGHGSGINPCIDCRIFILNKTKELMKKNSRDFIVTGEVLNERPMSQHRKAMITIDKETKLEGKVLRPLSAKVLEETISEKKGLIDRAKLFDISGRSRKPQIELAKKYNITYPHPAGGCLLCEKVFAERLDDFFERKPMSKIEPKDVQLLRIGRHFLFDKYKIIVGRNHEENILLKNLRDKKEKLFEFKGATGPTVMLQGKIDEESIKQAKDNVLRFSKNKDEIVEL